MDDLLKRVEAALAGRYEIESELGRGGMAVVYRGRDLRHERNVAIKVLPPHLASAIGHERFLHEIKLAAGLAHPYVVPILDSGRADGLLYYTMPVVRGETLQDRLRREAPLPIGEALTIACEVAEALAHAHAAGVLHRDVKPSNILLTAEHALLSDFGVARAAEASGDERLTGTGMIIGTPAYMSPQQALSEDGLDASADQYSLACVLYEMLAGRVPFDGGSPQTLLLSHATRDPVPLRRLRPEVSVALSAAVERAMAKDPEDRFPSITAFRNALKAETAGDPERGGTVGAGADGQERPALVRAGAVVLFGLVAAVAVWGLARLVSAPTEGPPSPTARLRVAVLPCQVIHGTESRADSILGRTTATQMYFKLDGVAGLELLPIEELSDIPYPGEDSLRTVARRLEVNTLVQCVLSPGPGDSVHLDYDVWTDGSVTPYEMHLARSTPGVLDVERFAIRLATLSSGDEPFEPTDDVLALRNFLLGYDAFIGERFQEAESLFAAAVRQDSMFALARWRQFDVRRWLLAPGLEDLDLRELYDAHRDRLGRRNALYVSAVAEPLEDRFARFEVVLDSLEQDAYAHLLYGDELFHRGPLYGLHLDSAEQVLRRATRLNPQFAPAWDHLALVLMRLGNREASDSALVALERAASPSPSDYPMPQLMRFAWREQFQGAENRSHRRVLIEDRARLPMYARVGVRYFDLTDLQHFLGSELVAGAPRGSEDWHSGTNALALAAVSRGHPTLAKQLWGRAAAVVPRKAKAAAALFAHLWSVVPEALGLEGFSPDREAIAELEAVAVDSLAPGLHRARAAWALALRTSSAGGPEATEQFERNRRRVRHFAETKKTDGRMSRHLEAVAAAREGRWREALELSSPLMAYDSVGIRERPFGRAVLYLQRGAWFAELARQEGDPALADSATAAWIWHLNTDLEEVPTREVQQGEVDAVLGTHARLRLARLAADFAAAGNPRDPERWRAIACRESGEVLRRWESAEVSLERTIEEMSDIRVRLVCPGLPP